ncbi:Gfo/Idh/MocA family protein [Enterococcus italicus]|uniref:Oxidoreductase, NAD-binding domain protein n=1 Tax=Enterococcus italicus (strain DSM 15952 / CCUG 50447 / LMG 22039 / TP 1.5) TaxID=888064 RepID=E6LFE3_ENTI1|nr:Gfo/Idh/MocA family oxidoreductase [Enterococcus italicus]EFU74083.1 oxidoreductase, NAD-binding domain protein [Enterococcus italicus DSM 15952]OJG56850.1 oxidoreductase [Enterococcus italicus DSM 15952]
MIKLGVIGTNWISHQFVDGALSSGKYQLTGVYSRKKETAEAFARQYTSCLVTEDLQELVTSTVIDVIYIASPNSLHYEQAKAALSHGKSVIVEKPAVSTPEELADLIQLANENNVYFFEAARNIHEANFQRVRDALPPIDQIQGASFTYMKYSSRYDEVLAGNEPNIFSLKFSGGSLMDLGVYLVYAAVGLFGAPRDVDYFAQKIATGVDGSGYGLLHYDTFDVVIHHGKTGDSFAKSEIYLADGTVELDGVNAIKEVVHYNRMTKETNFLDLAKSHENPLFEEAVDFATILQNPTKKDRERYESWLDSARTVHQILYKLRQKAGIVFPADQKE